MPKIEFPCAYPIKVMGFASIDFQQDVLSLVQRHAPEVSEEHIKVRSSSNGNFLALTITIEATGIEQLSKLFADLKTHASVQMVL